MHIACVFAQNVSVSGGRLFSPFVIVRIPEAVLNDLMGIPLQEFHDCPSPDIVVIRKFLQEHDRPPGKDLLFAKRGGHHGWLNFCTEDVAFKAFDRFWATLTPLLKKMQHLTLDSWSGPFGMSCKTLDKLEWKEEWLDEKDERPLDDSNIVWNRDSQHYMLTSQGMSFAIYRPRLSFLGAYLSTIHQ